MQYSHIFNWKIRSMIDKEKINKAIFEKRVEFQKHAIKRMIEERLVSSIVLEVVLSGEIIKEYHDDKPFPSILMLGYDNRRPIHVVCSYNPDADKVHIITNYKPTLEYYESDFKTRRKGK